MSSASAASVNIHAGCIQLGTAGRRFSAPRNTGVLLLGDSGAGKSELVLRLLMAGARLIADDRVDLCAERGWLFAKPPKALAGLLEVRGVGIVELPHLLKARIDLVVRLVAPNGVNRLPNPKIYRPKAAESLAVRRWPPLLELASDASTPAKIAVAAGAFSRYLFRHDRQL